MNNKKLCKIQVSEIIGSILGIGGAVIMAFSLTDPVVAWVLWFFSALSLSIFAYLIKKPMLLMLQVTFIAINVSGIVLAIK